MNKLLSFIWILMIVTGFLAGFYWNTGKLFSQTLQAQENSLPVINQAPIIREHNLGKLIKKAVQPEIKILFVGDIMLDRGVETLMQKNSNDYPFEKIKDFLDDFNLISANLEGPIVTKAKDFGPHVLQFAFANDSASSLLRNHINFVSLANNHTLNMGQIGLSQTRQYLEVQGIGFAGDPLKCGSDLTYKKNNFLFLAFNPSFSSGCTNDEYIATVTKVRSENPDKFLVINIHWGIEYKTINSKAQEYLAHALIDAGADLIIGHHPHVVENIELYKNKLIFYSLGNFIFDQYFNQNVQQGLAVDLKINDKEAIYKLHPIISQKSQPNLMINEDANKFLLNLGGVSTAELGDSIKSGQIIIKSK